MAHLHSIYDSDLHFLIDPVTRVITNQSENKNSMIQFDHNSERFTFELPRYVEEHDMLTCNHVEVHYVNIDAKNGDTAEGVYEVTDLQVSPHDDKVVICSWLVSHNATKYAGTLNFVLRFACITDDVDYIWNTAIYKNYAVQNGLYNSDPVVEQYADVLAQWYDSLFTASDDGVTNIGEAKAAAITAIDSVADERIADIEQAGQDVLTSLPEDYLELIENVAPPIVDSASGESIAVTDSANRKLRGLTLYGKSTQNGTPTPDAPVEIECVENPTVRAFGKNLLNNTLTSGTYLGCDVVVNEDGGVVINGTAEREGTIVFNNHLSLPVGEYVLCGKRTVAFLRTATNAHKKTFYSGDTITIEDATDYLLVGVYANLNQEFSDLLTYPVIRLPSIEDDTYEPYTEQTLPLTRTLHGIPVTSGGNYTDENGQQWICDEVDFERGVCVQRVFAHKVNTINAMGMSANNRANSSVPYDAVSAYDGANALCSHFDFATNVLRDSDDAVAFVVSNKTAFFRFGSTSDINTVELTQQWVESQASNGTPLTILYVLATPIETPLSPEELAAYAALRSNYPNTSVLNDGGAGMAVSYVADTKLYINRKIKEVTP